MARCCQAAQSTRSNDAAVEIARDAAPNGLRKRGQGGEHLRAADLPPARLRSGRLTVLMFKVRMRIDAEADDFPPAGPGSLTERQRIPQSLGKTDLKGTFETRGC